MTARSERVDRDAHGRISVWIDDDGAAVVERHTAESEITVRMRRGQGGSVNAAFDVAKSVDVSHFANLLDVFCTAADLHLDVSFRATKLASSHVVLEDTGLAMGMGLFEMLRARMEQVGANGAGSSLQTVEQFRTAGVSAAVSIEGRKYVKYLGVKGADDFRWRYVLGHAAFGGVRTEDIDDFIDALAGGMRGSFFLHERRTYPNPADYWHAQIEALGRAVAEAFAKNEARRGLPPGVKATLL